MSDDDDDDDVDDDDVDDDDDDLIRVIEDNPHAILSFYRLVTGVLSALTFGYRCYGIK